MHEQHKLLRLLQLISTLRKGPAKSISQLSRMLNVTERTVYRYINLLRDFGFNVAIDHNSRYILEKNPGAFDDFEDTIGFSLDEAALLKDAVLSVHKNDPLGKQILHKIAALSDLDLHLVTDTIYNVNTAKNLKAILTAIREKKCLELHNYTSINSEDISDRIVEPIGFTINHQALIAFEPASGKTKHFKVDRIMEARVLRADMAHQEFHESARPDPFGMAGEPPVKMELKLSKRAGNLLREEFPLTESALRQNSDGTFHCHITVHGFKGAGRFILGLADEIEIIRPNALITYLNERIRHKKF